MRAPDEARKNYPRRVVARDPWLWQTIVFA